jgi:hypothetical protein
VTAAIHFIIMIGKTGDSTYNLLSPREFQFIDKMAKTDIVKEGLANLKTHGGQVRKHAAT